MKLRSEIDTRSPIDAAKGVAKLSGLTLNLLHSKITPTSTKSNFKNIKIFFRWESLKMLMNPFTLLTRI